MPDGELGNFVSGADSFLSVLSTNRPFVGVGILKAEASVTLHEGTHIIADADVTIRASSNSAVLLEVSSDLIGMGYAKSDSNATVTIEKIVSILAITNKNLSTAARGAGEYSVLAGGVVWATSIATAEAIVNGSVAAQLGKVGIVAIAASIQNRADASTQIGSGAVSNAIDNGIFGYGKQKLKNYLQKKSGVAKGLDGIGNLRNDLGAFLFMNGPIGGFSEKVGNFVSDNGTPAESFKSFGGSFSLSYSNHSITATTQVGGTAIIQAAGTSILRADVIDRPVIIAEAALDNGVDADTKKQTPKKYAGSVAISVGRYTNTSTASILAGATVDSNGLVVEARTFLPYEFPLERVIGLGDALSKVWKVITARNFGATTSWAKASAASSEGGTTGSVNILTLASSATAQIDSDAQINQNNLYPRGDVTVQAETQSKIVNLVDNPLKVIGLVTGANGSGGGGALGGVYYTTTTQATIGSGALINAKDLSVDAKTDTYNVLLGLTAGKTKGFAINGVSTVVDVNDNTLAQISQGTVIQADGTVDVTANDVLFNINGAGCISIGKSVGVGVTVATNNVIRNTHALIGNQEVQLGQGNAALNTGVDSTANSIDLGYEHGFATGDAVIHSNAGDSGAIGGLVDGQTYYVININSNTVKLALTAEDASNGNALDLNAVGVKCNR